MTLLHHHLIFKGIKASRAYEVALNTRQQYSVNGLFVIVLGASPRALRLFAKDIPVI